MQKETKNNDLVVCIMPTYNRPEYIVDAVGSVLSQTYSNWLLLIMHDGPELEGANYPESIKTLENVIYFKHHKWTASPATIRNILLKKALEDYDPKYICFLDDDDEYCFSYMEKMIKFLDQNQDIDIVYTGRLYYNNVISPTTFDKKVLYPKEVVENALGAKESGYLAMSDCMIRSQVFKDKDIRFHSKTWQYGCEDADLFAKMYEKGYKFERLKDYLTKIRWHSFDEEPNHSTLRNLGRLDRLGDLKI